MLRAGVALILLPLISLGVAYAAKQEGQPGSCQMLLTQGKVLIERNQLDNERSKIEIQLDKATPGDTVIFKFGPFDNSYLIIRAKDVHSDPGVPALRKKDNFISEVSFSLTPLKGGGNELTVGAAKTAEEFQKRGVYKLLFAQILSSPEFDIRQISTILADTNLDAFNSYYYNRIWWKDRILSPKLSFMLALVHTPAYQIRMNFGFTDVIHYRRNKLFVEFVVVKHLSSANPQAPRLR